MSKGKRFRIKGKGMIVRNDLEIIDLVDGTVYKGFDEREDRFAYGITSNYIRVDERDSRYEIEKKFKILEIHTVKIRRYTNLGVEDDICQVLINDIRKRQNLYSFWVWDLTNNLKIIEMIEEGKIRRQHENLKSRRNKGGRKK